MNMKQIAIILQATILVGCASSLVSARRLTPNVFKDHEEVTGPFSCVLLQYDAIMSKEGPEPETDETNNFHCWDEIEDTYWVPKGLQKKFFEDESIQSGVSVLTVSSATKKKVNGNRPNELEVNPGSLVSLEVRANPNLRGKGNHQSRSLKQNSGISTVLVVRVIIEEPSDLYQPQASAADLAGDVFSDPVTLASQIGACSGGQLTFIPAPDSAVITDGVVEVTVTGLGFVAGTTAWQTVKDAAKLLVPDENTWNHVLYIMPREVKFNGASATAYLNHHQSFYWDWDAKLWVLMHEIGHNLGVRHAGLGGALGTFTLGDDTGYMGAGYGSRADDYPRQCYDAAKSFYFGWYSSGHTTIDTTVATSWSGRLIGIDDFLYSGNFDSTKHTSVLKIDRPGSDVDLYLMYNRAKGVNLETVMFPDNVTVMMQTTKGDLHSELYAGLSPGDVYRDNTWGANDLVIEACSQTTTTNVDEMVVIVYFDDGVNNIACPTPTQASSTSSPSGTPTGYPTSTSSASPTVLASESPSTSPAPSKSPTKAPTSSPTDSPTGTPTSSPTGSPTSTPSVFPTVVASESPSTSQAPSKSPTKSPTSSPTDSPTGTPTSSPTGYPTPTPSVSPTVLASESPSTSPAPSKSPTEAPTSSPTDSPTGTPSSSPTGYPTSMPSVSPTVLASESPSTSPVPSKSPTKAPTSSPTDSPTGTPSSSPSGTPTAAPTPAPTAAPTSACPAVGESCMENADCCSGLCSGGKPGTRTCLFNGDGPSPIDPPADPPTDPPGDQCLAEGETCSSAASCCSNSCHPRKGCN